MKERIQAYRELNFQKNILMEKQPASVIGLNLFRSWKLSNRTENSTVVKGHRGPNLGKSDNRGANPTIVKRYRNPSLYGQEGTNNYGKSI